MYYTYDNTIGGSLRYLNTVKNSELKDKYEFSTCFQGMAPKGLNLRLLRRMVKKIKEIGPDIVHIHGVQSEGLYGAVAAKLAGCKYVLMIVHGFAHDGSCYGRAKHLIYKHIVEPIALRLCDGVYCVSKAASERKIITRNCKKNNLGYIHNGVPALHLTTERAVMRETLNVAEDEFVFCCSGRLVIDKGYDVIAQAIKQLNNEGKSFRFIAIGDGDYRRAFSELLQEEIAAGQVIVTGQTDKVADYLNASDAFVFASRHENLSLALLEACQSGLPCIASNVGGNPEVIIDNQCGFVIDGFESEKFAEKMRFLMENPDRTAEMGKAAKDRVATQFSLSKMCRELDEVYKNGIQKARRSKMTK